jgi:hypothetical protein
MSPIGFSCILTAILWLVLCYDEKEISINTNWPADSTAANKRQHGAP